MAPQSAISNPQSAIANPQDWLTVDQAAELTGQSVRHCRRIAEQAFHRKLARKGPPPGGKGKAVWWVHRSLDKRLTRYPDKPSREDRARASLLSRFPEAHVTLAYLKARWLREWRDRCKLPRPAGVTDAGLARDIVAEAKRDDASFRISVRSLQIWHHEYNAIGGDGHISGVEALIPNYSGQRVGPASSRSGRHNPRSGQAIEYFYGIYHAQNGLKITTCHQMTLDKARALGWRWPANYSSTTRWLKERDDLAKTCLHRDGPKKHSHRYMAYREIDYSLLAVGEMYVADHNQCDFWVTDGDEQIRPWLTTFEDCRTRMIVGWHLGPAPHQDSILAACRMAFRDFAIPEVVRIDRGKDFCSQLITGVTKAERDRYRREHGPDWRHKMGEQSLLPWQGVLGELGIEFIYALPYHAWSKGQIERWYRTFSDQFCRTMATYCGNSTVTRPECLEEIRRGYSKAQKRHLRTKHGKNWKRIAVLKFVDQSAIPTLDEARGAFADYLELYRNTAHSADDMEGRSPATVWATATRLRRAVENELLSLMQARGVYRVGPNGVSFKVGSRTETYGAGHPAMQHLMGRDVFVTLDPDDTSHCFAFTAERHKRRFIARLEHNEKVAPRTSIDDLRKASASVGRRNKGRAQAAREAPAAMRTVAQESSAFRKRRIAALRATGTDDKTGGGTGFPAGQQPDIIPVRTGIEPPSTVQQSAVESPAPAVPSTGKLLAEFACREPVTKSARPGFFGALSAWADREKERDD